MNQSPLLYDFDKMKVKTTHFTALAHGHSPLSRPVSEHLKYGVICLDKPMNPSSHEVASFVRKIMKADKTGQSGTLDPSVTGCLIVCLNRATRLVKSLQSHSKEYVCVLEFYNEKNEEVSVNERDIKRALQYFSVRQFQRPPLVCAVKRQLRIRTIHECTMLYCEGNKAVFRVCCEAGTYVRTLCEHIGLFVGTPARMAELRRTRTGSVSEDCLVTMHDVLDSMWAYENCRDEAYLRRVVVPLELFLISFPRIVVKDSAVSAVCHGAAVTLPGIVKYDENIETGKEVVVITTKGEAVAIGIASMASSEIESCDHGIVCKLKRVIMEKELYPSKWGLGPNAKKRKEETK